MSIEEAVIISSAAWQPAAGIISHRRGHDFADPVGMSVDRCRRWEICFEGPVGKLGLNTETFSKAATPGCFSSDAPFSDKQKRWCNADD